METIYFSWLDYLVFGGMLLLSTLIGIYFAFFASKRQNTTSEYLMGGKAMGLFPVSMSLIASYISGISLLGLPAEMYTYGTQYWMIVASEWAVSLTVGFVYLPVFYNLQITSTYEYLRLRFNTKVRLFGSIIFIIKLMLYIPIVIYVPALAFNQVTGANLHLISPIVCVVCIFYTCLGGIKAVVWTDTLQTVLMYFGVVFVLIYGTWKVGGVGRVFQINEEGGRLEFLKYTNETTNLNYVFVVLVFPIFFCSLLLFSSTFISILFVTSAWSFKQLTEESKALQKSMDLDPTLRHTFWTTVFGNYFSWLSSCSVNHSMVQRCLSLSSLRRAFITVCILAGGVFSIVTLCCYTGLVIYATFSTCDPLAAGAIRKADQLLPYFVMTITGAIPALPGIFMSGVFSAALSTMSTGLNSMCCVIFEDMVRPAYNKPISEKHASLIMKIIVVVVGIACVVLVFVVEHLGALIQAGKSLDGITSGTLLGLFSMGLFLPWTNSTGALTGGIVSTAIMAWISIGTQMAVLRGQIPIAKKPISVEGCPANLTDLPEFTTMAPDFEPTPPFIMYRLSYLYYTLAGMIICIVVGVIVSFVTQPNDPAMVHRNLLTPVIHRWLPPPHPRCRLPRLTVHDIELQASELHKLEQIRGADINDSNEHLCRGRGNRKLARTAASSTKELRKFGKK